MVGQESGKLSKESPPLKPEGEGKEAWSKVLRQDELGPLQKAEEVSLGRGAGDEARKVL